MTDFSELVKRLEALTQTEIDCIAGVVSAFEMPIEITRNDDSDIATNQFCEDFGDLLRLHHCFSEESFTKDKFEFAMVRVLNQCNHSAEKSKMGYPGQDLTVDGAKWSLKSQADRNIKVDEIWISKFMELGSGDWSDDPKQLNGLRDQMLNHMGAYDRIFTLRCLSKNRRIDSEEFKYELVEIPKDLLQKAEHGDFEMKINSKQTPKPGYCRTYENRQLLFELYFDGGTERKLQIKKLLKNHCVLHASWSFSPLELLEDSDE